MYFDQILSKRELEICKMISKGLNSEEIAAQLHLSEGTIKNHVSSIFKKTGIKNRAQLVALYVVECEQAVTDVDPTCVDDAPPEYAKLRLDGLKDLPEMILLKHTGQPFVVGRYDISVGQKQCDFEFGKGTKAVSRRHASIEFTARGYVISDLNSRAGTYVNGNRVMPGTPCLLHNGDRVSFGNAGADYVFEG